MARMTRKELMEFIQKEFNRLATLGEQRNNQYAASSFGTENFYRNARYNELFRMDKIINHPAGPSIHYVVQKVDRLIGGLISTIEFKNPLNLLEPTKRWSKTMSDSIDDAIVYLLITKAILKEECLIEEN